MVLTQSCFNKEHISKGKRQVSLYFNQTFSMATNAADCPPPRGKVADCR